MRLLIFGYGFTGKALACRLKAEGWRVTATARGEAARDEAPADGVEAVDPAGASELACDAILVTAPPDDHGCPGIAALASGFGANPPRWIGYLSSTGVYGDRGGGWAFETSPVRAQSVEGARRAAAEHDWLTLAHERDLPVAVFRLPGIYGPGRSTFDRLRQGTAHRFAKPGQVFSRIHVDDLAEGLCASIRRPRAGALYNLCDDEPASASEVTAYAAALLGLEPPPERPFDPLTASSALVRFYAENKRVSNALAKAELGWRPAHPSYREGLAAVLRAEGSD